MPSVDPMIQDLLRKILTVDPVRRIKINQIKEHPAFHIGLPFSYILPTPLPIPAINNPITLDFQQNSNLNNDINVDSILDSLQHIGFKDRFKLISLLKSNAPNMAKVFYLMIKNPFDPDLLPWDQSSPNTPDSSLFYDHPFVCPFDLGNISSDPFDDEAFPKKVRSTSFMATKEQLFDNSNYNSHSSSYESSQSSPLYSPTYNIDWIPKISSIICEQEQSIENIEMSLISLMNTLQQFLTSHNFDWFYPNYRTFIVRYVSQSETPIYIILNSIYDMKDLSITLSVKMLKGTANEFFSFFQMLQNIFIPDVKVMCDEELNDFNKIEPNLELRTEDYSPNQNCNPM